MKKVLALLLAVALLLPLISCSNDDGTSPTDNPDGDNTPGGLVTSAPDITDTPPPTPRDPTGGLPRGDDGVLIGSVVFDEPILLIGMPIEDPTSPIRVRTGPSVDHERLTTILRGEVVEATEIVDGWYHITVSTSQAVGYVRSDLLALYEEGGGNDETPDDADGTNIFRDDDPSGLPRGSDGILIGSTEFDSPMMLMGMGTADNLIINVRAGPSLDAERVSSPWGTVTIGKGQVAEAFGVEKGWYRVRVLPGMFEGYIRSDLLVPYDESKSFYAKSITNFDSKMSSEEEIIITSTLVDVRTLIPDIEYCLIFSTPENFYGKPLYSRDVPLLQAGTAEKLKAAQELFKADGYRIKLFDAYRPSSVSGILYDIIGDTKYVARAGTSYHNRAAAVDITLVDADGVELEMPSQMHTFNSTSHRDSPSMSAEAKKNMDYMTNIMKQAGLSDTINSEWWHFNDPDRSKYLPMDIEFRILEFTAVG